MTSKPTVHAVYEEKKSVTTSTVKVDMEIPHHIQDLVKHSCEGWNEDQLKVIKELLIQHSDTFAKNADDIGNTHLIQHPIDTGVVVPVAQLPHQVPLAFAKAEKNEIEKMLKHGIVCPSTSPWASPLCLVKKPDGSTRVCIDYQALNIKTTLSQHPIPQTRDCLDSLGGAVVFSVGDSPSAYH